MNSLVLLPARLCFLSCFCGREIKQGSMPQSGGSRDQPTGRLKPQKRGESCSTAAKEGPQPASPAAMGVLTEQTLQQQVDCAVCLEPVQRAKVLPCGHSYHNLCIMAWFAAHNTCPMCRCKLIAAQAHSTAATESDVSSGREVMDLTILMQNRSREGSASVRA